MGYTNKDNNGRAYFHTGNNTLKTEGVVCIDGKNQCFEGEPHICIRKGNSKFGEQVVFSFFIKGKLSKYSSNTTNDNFEFYLKKKDAYPFIKELIDILENDDKKELTEEDVLFKSDDWEEVRCNNCGSHLQCNKCNDRYCWRKKDDKTG